MKGYLSASPSLAYLRGTVLRSDLGSRNKQKRRTIDGDVAAESVGLQYWDRHTG